MTTTNLLQLPDRRLRLAFFGTPDIARVMLERLLDVNEDDVVFVVCQPDKPKGRGKKVEPPPVKALAEARGLEVVQPAKLRDGVLAAKMRDAQLDLAIVVAYGRILPDDVFGAPAFGTWNVHASLLPRHRGASPIQHAILAGDPETGVALMQLTAGLDEGPVMLEKRVALTGDETGGSLTESLAVLGADVLVEGLRLGKRTGLTVTPQDAARATYAPILEKAHGTLDFTRPAAELARRVRALNPWPSAFVLQADGQPIKVLVARAAPASSAAVEPGQVSATSDGIHVRTSDGDLVIAELQPPGKRPMPASDFLRGAGRHLAIGTPFPGC
ncbi:methionyl-tRNA formyltransferase [Myxococcota bacterium]|nr:methionyl-tRNA formyltransferase [Myxococcota bacterium]